MTDPAPDPLSAACAELVEATAKLVEACSALTKALGDEQPWIRPMGAPPPQRWGETHLAPGIRRITADGRRVT